MANTLTRAGLFLLAFFVATGVAVGLGLLFLLGKYEEEDLPLD